MKIHENPWKSKKIPDFFLQIFATRSRWDNGFAFNRSAPLELPSVDRPGSGDQTWLVNELFMGTMWLFNHQLNGDLQE
jgi:hypothetical protein